MATDAPDARDGETDREGDDEDGGLSNRVVAAAVIAVVGVVGSGVADFLLSQLGAPVTGAAVWVVGYLSTVIALWYVLLRPLDLRGP
jgi:cation transporter-like permease